MGNKLGGTRGQSYLGVGASNPPDTHKFINRNPNQYDNQGYSIFDFGQNTLTKEMFQLIDLQGDFTSAGALAEWVPIAASSVGFIQSITGDDSIAVLPNSSGTVFLKADATAGSSVKFLGNVTTFTESLNVTDINANTLIGFGAGNTTLSGSENTGLGFSALSGLTTGSNNTAIGYDALADITSGSNNTVLGRNAGVDYTGAESNNILIANLGTTGDNNTTRIGSTQLAAYIAGVSGVTVANPNFVTINTVTGQLGSTVGSGGSGTNSSFFGSSPSDTTIAASSIQWLAPYGEPTGTKALAQFSVPAAGTISNLYVNVGSNSSTANVTVTLNKNGSNTSTVATITALTTGVFTDLTHSFTVVPGDTIQFESSATTAGPVIGTISAEFSSANGSSSTIYDANTGTATPSGGILNIVGDGTTATTTATGNTITITAIGGGGFTSINRQVFTTTGTYTPTTGMFYCDIEVIGGGGGGASSHSAGANSLSVGASAGGGGYARGIFSAATIGASKSVTIGSGGAGSPSGSSPGATGGTTSVGTLISATGGASGGSTSGSSNSLGAPGGTGGIGTGGDFQTHGSPGGYGSAVWVTTTNYFMYTGNGGSTFFGGGALGVTDQSSGATVGNNATSYGGGGGGSTCAQITGSAAGGNGFAGIVIVTEYI